MIDKQEVFRSKDRNTVFFTFAVVRFTCISRLMNFTKVKLRVFFKVTVTSSSKAIGRNDRQNQRSIKSKTEQTMTSSSSSSSATFMTKKCIGIIVATTAVVACIALFSTSSSSNHEQDVTSSSYLQQSIRKLQKRTNRIAPNLPLVIVRLDGYDDDLYDDDQYWSPNHGGHYFNKDDDYTYSYTPVDTTKITPTKGGYGGRQGRSLSEIRFNKIPPIIDGYGNTNAWRYTPSRDYIKGVHSSVFPLMASDYPLVAGSDKVTVIVRETMADSVVLPGDYQLHGDTRPSSYWLEHAYNTPVYPGNPLYWDELRHVVQVQIARRNGDSPSSLNHWPATWEEMSSLTDIANAVKGEYPGYHQATIIEQMFKDGIEMHRDMSPFRSAVDFVGTEVRMASINIWSVEEVAAIDFMLKWNVGMPRPEEVVWLIANGGFTTENDDIPADIVTLIKSMNLSHAAEFTAYEDGSPMHPSYPAMHSAGSTCSYWIPAICKITPDQYCEALRVDYATSYARTVAGVHYQMDNIAGLNIGQRIIRENFPSMMEEKYGYKANMLRTKMEALSFDWNTFDSDACTIDGVSASDFLENAYSADYD